MHKRKVQPVEVDIEEDKTVIEVLKVQAEANKTVKAFDTPVNTGLGAPTVGLTSSTLTGRTPSYYTDPQFAHTLSRRFVQEGFQPPLNNASLYVDIIDIGVDLQIERRARDLKLASRGDSWLKTSKDWGREFTPGPTQRT
ncbi:hypothetical protein Esti_001149 [Eimeria stiedai]